MEDEETEENETMKVMEAMVAASVAELFKDQPDVAVASLAVRKSVYDVAKSGGLTLTHILMLREAKKYDS
jgi:hypothetical protein